MRHLAKTVAGLASIASVLVIGGAWAAGSLSFTRDVRERGSYFRMKVQLRHAGQAIDQDIVVACGARITSYKDGGSSVDVDLYPYKYAAAIPGGHAVQLRMPTTACKNRTTANGEVPKDFLPYVIWHESADDLSLGILYASDDAYRQPDAKLEFLGAVIESATRADFDHWRATADRNLILTEMATFTNRAPPKFKEALEKTRGNRALYTHLFGPGSRCYAVRRLEIPEEVRPAVAALRPPGNPRYWTLPAGKRTPLGEALRERRPAPLYEGHPLEYYLSSLASPGNGIARRDGTGFIHARRYQGTLFPVRSELGIPWITEEIERTGAPFIDVEDDPKKKGFAYCFGLAPEGILFGNDSNRVLSIRHRARIGGELIFNFNDMIYNDASVHFVIEDDRYFITSIDF